MSTCRFPWPAAALASLLCGAFPSARPALAQSPAPEVDTRQGSYLATGGDNIFYQVSGSGPFMLLIHGFPLTGELFKDQVAALSGSYTVITPDLPGFGRSMTGTQMQTDQNYAADMFALLDHLGAQTAIIGGHSMGGQVTLEMYKEQPTRFTGMILFDTNPSPASIVEQAMWPAFGVQAMAMGSASIEPPVVAVMATGAALMARPSLGANLKRFVYEGSPSGIAGGGNALATRPDFTLVLPTISVPTLIIEGQDDTVYPYQIALGLKTAIPGATYSLITGAGHASMFQRPTAANDAITGWLSRSGLSAH